MDMKPESRLKWYIDALEALGPLRYHMFQLMVDIESCQHMSSSLGGKFGLFNLRSLEAAKVALSDAEFFFTGSRPTHSAAKPTPTNGESCDP